MSFDIIDIGRSILDQEPVCDSCLGRVVANRSHGLSNTERGKALRIVIAMQDDEPIEVTETVCWVCDGSADRIGEWADRVVDALEGIEFETYQIGSRVPPLLEENDRLLRETAGVSPDVGESIKTELNREVGKRVGSMTGTSVDFDRPDVVALLEIERETVDVRINPAYVYGRYRKLKREIPQTEWPCTACGGSGREQTEDGPEVCSECDGSGLRYELSVEQLTVPPVVEAMDGSEGVFHGAGREDVDARMLGNGRPFVIEVKHPRIRRPHPEKLEAEINDYAEGAVEVEGLRLVDYRMVERVKELDASKRYRMQVEFDEPVGESEFEAAIAQLDGATIEQRTPNRVSHRRSDRVRTRIAHEVTGRLIDPRQAELEVHGEGGLYVKELVSGDGGRTKPSLAGALGVDARVTALDVVGVSGDLEVFLPDRHILEPVTD